VRLVQEANINSVLTEELFQLQLPAVVNQIVRPNQSLSVNPIRIFRVEADSLYRVRRRARLVGNWPSRVEE
jgi:hypothetical protein